MIPKIIYYCWQSVDKKPVDIQRCIDNWQRHLPDFEIRLWDIDSFDFDAVPFTRAEAYIF